MKRPIVIVAMLYVAGLSAGALLAIPPTLTLALIALIGLSQVILLAMGRPAVDALLFAAVFLIGDYQHSRIETQDKAARNQLAALDSQSVVRIEGRLAKTDRVYRRRITYRLVDCVIHSKDGSVLEFPTAIQLACSGEAFEKVSRQPPAPGDRVVVDEKLVRPPDLSNPDVFNYRAYLENHGVGASVLVRRADAVMFSPPLARRSPRDLVIGWAERLRRWTETNLENTLEPEIAALNRSIFLGEAERLDPGVRRDFTRCGLAHIFAVSGLNVVLLVWILDLFVRLFRPKPRVRSALLIGFSIAYCAAVGFQASVVRATIMFAAILVAPFLRYQIEALTALAAAALVILAIDPRALWHAGFQLTFACMLSIILLKPLLDNWLWLDEEKGTKPRKVVVRFTNRRVISGMTMIVSAQVGILPFLAHYFYMIPFVGVLSNLLAAPLVWLIMAATTVLLGANAVVPAVAWIVGDALNLFGHALLGLVQFCATLPLVTVSTPRWPLLASALFYVVLFGWAVLPREPSPFFEAKQRARLAIAFAAIVAWVVWVPAVLRGSGDTLHATFLDVGQGDSCVLEMPGGPVVLVDGGDSYVRAGERVIAPFLEARGIDHLDAIIATHPDSDHIGGLPAVFRALDVAWLIEGPGQSESQVYQRLQEAAKSEFARHDLVFAGDWIEAPMGTRLLFLHPPRGAAYSRANDESLVLLVDWRECEILLAGDIEHRGEDDLLASGADLACDVLKVAHHGSDRATSPAFLDRARPRLAIISCGRDNPFGHPSPDVLDRLTSAGVTIARADRDGAVTVRSNGRSLEWRTEGKIY